MRICIDLDNTLCIGKPYEDAIPVPGAKEFLTALRAAGCTVIIYTARGMGSCSSHEGKALRKIGKLTLEQLEAWDFDYDEIYFGKPSADFYLDDKNLLLVNYEQILETVKSCLVIGSKHEQIFNCS